MPRILRLSPETISQIHSSKNITSVQGVVLALLENSLDAGSNKIEITIDFRRGGCTIEDNGSGIPPGEFLENGGLGKMFHTSKHTVLSNYELHGTTGTYLASLSALSLLGITSHHVDHNEQATLTMHQDKVIARQIPASSINELPPSTPHGTRATVRDLFGNMPVRVKQRALAAEEGNSNQSAWLELKLGIVALLLAWPKPCAVRIRDSEYENRMLHLFGAHPTVSAGLTKKGLEKLAGKNSKFDLRDVLPILSQAGLAPVESMGMWVPVSASTPKLSVRGAIHPDPAPTKQCQFISIGIHPCSTTTGNNELYDGVNRLFSNSSFGAVDDDKDTDEAEKDRRKRDRRYKSDGYTRKQTHGRKGVDRWPMFVLQVRFSHQHSQNLVPEHMSESNIKAIIEVLGATVTQWLAANHFRPRKLQKSRDQTVQHTAGSLPEVNDEAREITTPISKQNGVLQSATTSKKRKYVDITGKTRTLEQDHTGYLQGPSDYFSSWSRIKSGQGSFYDRVAQGKKPATAPEGPTGTGIGLEDARPKHGFDLPVLEAGELSSIKGTARKSDGANPVSENATTTDSNLEGNVNLSSEDYGSFDDPKILATLENPRRVTNDSIPAQSGESDEFVTSTTVNQESHDAVVDWTDPVTKQTFKVNARTGVVLPTRPISIISHSAAFKDSPTRNPAGVNTLMSSKGYPLSLARRPASSKSNADKWLPGFLKDWDNPVFAQQGEERIPATSFALSDARAIEPEFRHCVHDSGGVPFPDFGSLVASSLTKASLKEAKIIKQVDQKYILCKTWNCDGDTSGVDLVLIDQHAASERVMLEGLLAELCTPPAVPERSRSKVKTTRLERLLRFQIPEVEYKMFHSRSQHFADWGILYELAEKEESLSASQVRAPKREYTIIVEYLPPGIAERCVLVPKLLIELLRAEVWNIMDVAKTPKTPQFPDPDHESAHGGHGWLKQLGSCPKGIIDMLNSRACRSAIMFNDELSVQQCQTLLSDLSKCAFPFICAHGRVSMVPLIKTGNALGGKADGMISTIDESADEGFAKAFRDWRPNAKRDSNSMIRPT